MTFITHSERVVRLRGRRGLLEVKVNQYWGTVCDDYFGWSDAHVFCHYLGFARANRIYTRGRAGQGRGPIMFDNMHCRGNEPSPFHCRHNGFQQHNCRHSEDVGISCVGYDEVQLVPVH